MRGSWVCVAGLALGSVPPTPWSIERDSWIDDPAFFEPFTYLEKKQHFCQRSWMAPSKPREVFFSVWDDSSEWKAVEQLCPKPKTQLDAVLLQQMRDHPWRVPRGDGRAVMHYLPSFAGPILAGECEAGAKEALAKYFLALRAADEWNKVHGHNFIHLASTPEVYQSVYNQSKLIFMEHFRYNQEAMKDPKAPEYLDNIPYTLSQMVSLQDIYVPGLQYCQLFRPIHLLHTPPASEVALPVWADYIAARPIEYFIAEPLGPWNDPKYQVRQQVIQDMVDGKLGDNFKVIVLQSDDLGAIGASKAPTCKSDANAPVCTAGSLDELSELRASIMPTAQWYVLTRGAMPHEENLYQAVWAETLIVNTIDKNLDHALPFQCTVQWEDFTVRVGSERTKKNPRQEILNAVAKLRPEQLTKMLRYIKYYGPELDYVNNGDGEAARNTTNLPENILLGAMRRCYPEQWLNERRLSAGQMQCCGNEYAKFSIIARRYINVEVPPWMDF